MEIKKPSTIEKIIEKQIRLGNDEDYGSFESYGQEDLFALVEIETSILKNNNFKTLELSDFNKKIKKIFGRIIDANSSTNFMKIDPFFDGRCDFKLEFYPYTANNQYLYVDKNNKFITYFLPLPTIIDYKKIFPHLSKIEEKEIFVYDQIEEEKVKISQWKDEKDLDERRSFNEQLLIHRNKYLFNDNKASLAWLKVNDIYFLESLVKTFGYTEDKDLLNWVMERNKEESDARSFINKYLFVRNCKGELEIRDGILKYIAENTSDDEGNQTFANELSNYSIYDSPNNWTEQERYKIIAYQANTYDYLFGKSNILGNTNRGRISVLGGIFYNSFVNDDEQRWKELEQNFKDNNYYNLPHLKSLVSEALKFEPGYF